MNMEKEFLLGSLRDGRLKIVEPFKVRLQAEDDYFIQSADEISEFGIGKNPSEALVDLQHSIAELYLELHSESKRLGPDLQSVFELLQTKIEVRNR